MTSRRSTLTSLLMAAIFAVPHLGLCIPCSGAPHAAHSHSDSPAHEHDLLHTLAGAGGADAGYASADGSWSLHDAHLCLCLCHSVMSPGTSPSRTSFPAPEPSAEEIPSALAEIVPDRLDRPPRVA